MRHIKVLGITGGVGAGKSTVLQYLSAQYGARVIELDRAAHEQMRPGTDCCQQICEVFGKQILAADGQIDRRQLAEIVFADQKKLRQLNAIVHPAVKQYIKAEIAAEEQAGEIPFLVLEAALLLEDHYETICDEIWYVYVDDETRKQRLFLSRGYTAEKTEAVLRSQMSDQAFREACQFVIDNSSDNMQNTYRQIDKGLKEHGFL